MKMHDIEFEDDLRPFDVENDYADFFEFSPTGKVPVLQDDGHTVFESLAILEYLAERFPGKALWPKDQLDRSDARSISHEMHAGFTALRAACPMNMRRAPSSLSVDDKVIKDVRRIEEIWRQCLDKSGGPFLFGDFTIADGMYAPIVNRLEIYELSSSQAVKSYTSTIKNLQHWKE